MKYLITLPAICLSLLSLYLLQSSQVQAMDQPVKAQLGGFTINTTVDSEIARQVLTGRGDALSPAEFDRLSASLTCNDHTPLPSHENLALLSRDYSPDTATALLIKCLLQTRQVHEAQSLFLAELATTQQGLQSRAQLLRTHAEHYVVLIVPGWGYQSSSDETGADLATPRKQIEQHGFETQLAPLEDNGSVEQNARILSDHLRELLQGSKHVVLASASSGGPTVALALANGDIANHPRLRGWLNLCGVLNGSPVIDRFTHWPNSLLLRTIALFEGWRYANLLSLSGAHSRPRFNDFTAPPQLTIVNYIGVPFSGQISHFGRKFYAMLKRQGPNDGLTYIIDALAPGHSILAVGSDHFLMEDTEIDAKTEALLPVMLKLIERQEQQVSASVGSGYNAALTP